MPNPYLQNNKNPISRQHLRNIYNINIREIVQCRKFETMQCSADFGCKKNADFMQENSAEQIYSLRNLNKHIKQKQR